MAELLFDSDAGQERAEDLGHGVDRADLGLGPGSPFDGAVEPQAAPPLLVHEDGDDERGTDVERRQDLLFFLGQVAPAILERLAEPERLGIQGHDLGAHHSQHLEIVRIGQETRGGPFVHQRLERDAARRETVA